jgi:hypothetical protein
VAISAGGGVWETAAEVENEREVDFERICGETESEMAGLTSSFGV